MRTKIQHLLLLLAVLMLAVQPLFAQDAANLKSRVVVELARYYDASFKIMVDKPGVVTISGTVPSYWDKINVFAIVSRVVGVREISNLLEVNTEMVADNTIKADVEHALSLNSAIVEPNKIQVIVNKGLVILRGTVSFRREAEAAEDIAAWNHGVKSVDNQLLVLSPKQAVSDQNLLSILRETLDRYFPLEKNTVQVKVEQGQVTLNGTVNQLWVRYQIEKEIRHIQGVRGVDNKIEITRVS